MSSDLDAVRQDTAALADAVSAAPAAPVACYDGWDLAELARHVGTIHRWVTEVVRSRATERPPWPDISAVADGDLAQWLVQGADDLVEVLAAAPPTEEVWTFSPTGTTCGFWRQRMALETAIHRWDAENALGRDAVLDDDLAIQGVDEALHVYLEPRLEGRDVGGGGQRVAFVPDGSAGWTLELHADGVRVTSGHHNADAVVAGPAPDVWLVLMCRRGLDAVEVTGDGAAARLAARAATLVPGPAG